MDQGLQTTEALIQFAHIESLLARQLEQRKVVV
jgi:hypothetical protein